MQLQPVVSASPDGEVRFAPDFGGCASDVELDEDAYRERLIDRAEAYDEAEFRWQNQVQRLTNASEAGPLEGEFLTGKVSARQATIREFGELGRRNNREGGSKSRSHELHKSRLRLVRRGR